jgi:hypothetical protein
MLITSIVFSQLDQLGVMVLTGGSVAVWFFQGVLFHDGDSKSKRDGFDPIVGALPRNQPCALDDADTPAVFPIVAFRVDQVLGFDIVGYEDFLAPGAFCLQHAHETFSWK